MDLEMTTSCFHLPLFWRAALIITIVYAIGCLIWRFRSGAPAVLASIPLFLHVPVAWIQFAQVAEARALAGGGVASTAAGLAQALRSLLLGASVSAALALVAALLARRGSLHAAAAVIAGIAATVGATLWFAASMGGHADARTAFIGSMAAAATGVTVLAIAWRFRTESSRGRTAAALFAVAIVCAAAALIVRQQIAEHVAVAVRGFV
ncbi:MAG TPA: hypothetical protein VEU30_05510 [Thermoanaerobaculia bacterium]|nr:hypothetical protein [Thermoanaerobaculia bacterium]